MKTNGKSALLALVVLLLQAQPATAGPRFREAVTIIGDSTSAVYMTDDGAYHKDRYDKTWPHVAFPDAFIVNLASPGSYVADYVNPENNIPTILEAVVPLINPATSIVVLHVGTNDCSHGGDTVAAIVGRLDRLLAAVRAAAPSAQIVFVGLRHSSKTHDSLVDTWNDRERELAASVNGKYVDLTSLPEGDVADFPDDIHPNAAGTAKIAALIRAALSTK